MAILYYDNNGLVRTSAPGEGFAPGLVDASFKKLWFDENKNQGLLELINARITTIKDVSIVNDIDIQVAGVVLPIIGKDEATLDAENFYRSIDTFQALMQAGREMWAGFTTDAERTAFIVANFGTLMEINDGMLGFLKYLIANVLKVSRL